MKTRTLFLAALTVALLSSFSSSARADDTVYKISLVNGDVILSAAAPVPNGSMLLVKNLSNGSLTGVPAELVSNISKARTADTALGPRPVKTTVPASRLVTLTDAETGGKSVIVLPDGQKVSDGLTGAKMAGTVTSADLPAALAARKRRSLSDSISIAKTEGGLTLSLNNAKPTAPSKGVTMKVTTALDPGQKVFLGPTGGTSAAANRVDTLVVSPSAASFAASSLSVDPFAASIRDQIFAGDLPRLTPRSGLTAGTVTPIPGEVVIGPNGFPAPVTASGAFPIGPNGFGFTRAGGAIPTAVPVTVSAATAATTGSIAVPAALAIAPAAASLRGN
jgi:hypothetical protein